MSMSMSIPPSLPQSSSRSICGKWRIGVALAAAVCCALSAGVMQRLRSGRPSLNRPQATQPAHAPEAALRRLEAIAAETTRQRLAHMPEPPPPPPLAGFPHEALRTSLTTYREMLAAQGLFNQQATRKQLMAQLLKSPHGVGIAAQSVREPAFARQAFGDFQAEARYFSIQVLREAALQGNEQHLLQSAGAVAQSLAAVSTGNNDLELGRSADLRELIHAYIDVKGTEAFASGDVRLMSVLGYASTLPANVKSIYDETLFMRLRHEYGRESASAIVGTLLDG